MMRRRAELSGDVRVAAAVPADPDPQRAEALGREVTGFDTEHRAAVAFDVVVEGDRARFARPGLRDHLRGTGERVLVEAGPDDRVRGIGPAADHPDVQHPDGGRGGTCSGRR